MAFSARGREESRCVLVRLDKSEVTALTHRYISPYATEGRRRVKPDGETEREARRILSKKLQLILRDEKNKHPSMPLYSLFFFSYSTILIINL